MAMKERKRRMMRYTRLNRWVILLTVKEANEEYSSTQWVTQWFRWS